MKKRNLLNYTEILYNAVRLFMPGYYRRIIEKYNSKTNKLTLNFLIINHYAGAPGLGMELRPYYFARELIKKGHKVTIVASSYSHYRAKQPKVDNELEKEIIESISYYWIKTPQ